MKRFKIGFLATVAILAMSFTVIDNTGALKSVRLAAPTDCFIVPTAAGEDLDIRKNCQPATPITEILSTDNCTAVQVNDKIYDLDENDWYDATEIEENCNNGGIFCCVKITVDDQPCTDAGKVQPAPFSGNTNKYKVSQVLCKTN